MPTHDWRPTLIRSADDPGCKPRMWKMHSANGSDLNEPLECEDDDGACIVNEIGTFYQLPAGGSAGSLSSTS